MEKYVWDLNKSRQTCLALLEDIKAKDMVRIRLDL